MNQIPAMTRMTRVTTCQRCGTEETHTASSDYPEVYQLSPPRMWLLAFSPPGESNLSFRQYVCEACAKDIGGAILATQVAACSPKAKK